MTLLGKILYPHIKIQLSVWGVGRSVAQWSGMHTLASNSGSTPIYKCEFVLWQVTQYICKMGVKSSLLHSAVEIIKCNSLCYVSRTMLGIY